MAADLFDRQVQKRLSPAARKAFFKIAAWKIRDEEAKQLLGGISNGAFLPDESGDTKTPLDQDRLTRASLLVGIFKVLNVLYSGESPLAYMVKGGQLAVMRVRQLLDSRRVAG